MDQPENEYSEQYSEQSFWEKLLAFAKVADTEVVERALWLFHAAEDSQTPLWAKGVIAAALGYFISPIDAIPDAIPAVGYSDDLGVLALARAAVAVYITPVVKEKARKNMKDWFA